MTIIMKNITFIINNMIVSMQDILYNCKDYLSLYRN